MIENIKITNAKYIKEYDEDMKVTGDNTGIRAEINGKLVSIPLDPDNSDYAEILKQVADGDLTIKDAD